jgi:hypothetical protein
MIKKQNENASIEKELSLIDSNDPDSIVPNAKQEMSRIYALWDAVFPQ